MPKSELNVTVDQLFATIGRQQVENAALHDRIRKLEAANADLVAELQQSRQPTPGDQPPSDL